MTPLSSSSIKISVIQDLLPLLEQVVQNGVKLLIIAEDIEGEALSTLDRQPLRGTLPWLLSRLPASVTAARRCFADIANPDRRHRHLL